MVKKLKNVWGKIVSDDNIEWAYHKAKKGKAKYNLPLIEGVIFATSRMKISLPLKFLDFFEKNYFE